MPRASGVSLVLADVDGTLVDKNKVLTERAQAAVRALRKGGIRFAITSGRPPRGMAMLFDPLELDTPIAGFNGGLFVDRHLTILARHTVPEDVGKLAARARVKTLVLSHLVPGDDPSLTDEMWTEGVKKHFSGRVIVGKDLMEVSLPPRDETQG